MNQPRLFSLNNDLAKEVQSTMIALIIASVFFLIILLLFELFPDSYSCSHQGECSFADKFPIYITFFILIGLSNFGVWYYFRRLKTLPDLAMMVDDDGIWPASRSKEDSLIPWDRIRRTREDFFMQRLDLMDAQGQVLLKLDYQISDIGMLHNILREKICRTNYSLPALPLKFYTGLSFKLIVLLLLAGFCLEMLIWIAVETCEDCPQFLVPILVFLFGSSLGAILFVLLTEVHYKLVLNRDSFEFHLLLSTQRYPYHQLDQVNFIIERLYYRGGHLKIVILEIALKGEKEPIILQVRDGDFKVDLNYLCQILRQLAKKSRSS